MTLFYSEEEVVQTVHGLTRTRLTAFVQAEIVTPVRGERGPVYRQVDVARLQLLHDLSDQFEMSDDALAVVMTLIDQLHAVRADLRSVLRAITDEPVEVRQRLGLAIQRR
jgi:chaperone modulatory protein CbpM